MLRVLELENVKMYVRTGYNGDSETERVGKAHCIETLNCNGNTLVHYIILVIILVLILILITAAETIGPLNQSSIAFFSELGRKIASISSFLFQRISITIQPFNSILLHNSFSSDEA